MSDGGFTTSVPIRWSDMDVFAHVNHARMVTLLEEARIPWLFAEGRPTRDMRSGCLVADLHVRYQGQIRHEDTPVEVTMFTVAVRAVDFTVGYEVRRRDEDSTVRPSVVASTQLVSYDVGTQAPRRMSDAEKDYLRGFLRPDARVPGR